MWTWMVGVLLTAACDVLIDAVVLFLTMLVRMVRAWCLLVRRFELVRVVI